MRRQAFIARQSELRYYSPQRKILSTMTAAGSAQTMATPKRRARHRHHDGDRRRTRQEMLFVPRERLILLYVGQCVGHLPKAGQMRRRDFITALGAAATWPLAARAQQSAKMKRIAIVSPATKVGEITSGLPQYRAFFEELNRLGYVEGQNLGVERYSGKGNPNAMPIWSAMSSKRIPI